MLIRLCGCAGWFAPLLVAYGISRFSHDKAHFISYPQNQRQILRVNLYCLSCSTTKPTKWLVHPAKTQISMGFSPVWSESSLCILRIAKDPKFLNLVRLGLAGSSLGVHVILLVLSGSGSFMFIAGLFYCLKHSQTSCWLFSPFHLLLPVMFFFPLLLICNVLHACSIFSQVLIHNWYFYSKIIFAVKNFLLS